MWATPSAYFKKKEMKRIQRVSTCPMRMLGVRMTEIENQASNQLTQFYLENCCLNSMFANPFSYYCGM